MCNKYIQIYTVIILDYMRRIIKHMIIHKMASEKEAVKTQMMKNSTQK
ncbi:hypothetical protein BCF58_0387 [Chryseobacterium defluvii]|uniref:Uncharacterized protein n=1 Tax=Chryseobacterium defluvii TaxID=160396 RepID=A0A495SNS7_9FLAO|nr:hypothetical protein BCF58_0387 [Chryseobacterium defluvii]